MGGGSSKTTSNIDIVNNSIINAIVSAAQNCTGSTTATQNITNSGLGIFNTATQTVSVSITCLQKVVVDSTLLTQMAQNIINDASANSISLPMASSSSTANQNISNYLATTINTSFVQNCVSSAAASQTITSSGVQIGNADSQTLSTFQSCISNALNSNNVAQGLVQNTTNTSAASTSSPLSLSLGLGSLLSSTTGEIILLIIVCVVIAWLAWPWISKRMSGKNNKEEDDKEDNIQDVDDTDGADESKISENLVNSMPLLAEAALAVTDAAPILEPSLLGAALAL